MRASLLAVGRRSERLIVHTRQGSRHISVQPGNHLLQAQPPGHLGAKGAHQGGARRDRVDAARPAVGWGWVQSQIRQIEWEASQLEYVLVAFQWLAPRQGTRVFQVVRQGPSEVE